jgi:hypothetical protein
VDNGTHTHSLSLVRLRYIGKATLQAAEEERVIAACGGAKEMDLDKSKS